MSYLHNDTRTLRLHLAWVDKEAQPPHRLLGTVAVEYYDRRDQEYWPIVRLPVLYADPNQVTQMGLQFKELSSGKVLGFTQNIGTNAELALQISEQEGDGFLFEVGLDLGPYLQETAGRTIDAGANLALFRWRTSMAELVQFGGTPR